MKFIVFLIMFSLATVSFGKVMTLKEIHNSSCYIRSGHNTGISSYMVCIAGVTYFYDNSSSINGSQLVPLYDENSELLLCKCEKGN